MYTYKNSATNSKEPTKKCTKEKFLEILGSAIVAKKIAEYRDDLKKLKNGDITKEFFNDRKKLTKGSLPVFMFQAREFINGERNSDNALPSGMSPFDLDHIGDANAFYINNVESRIDELGIVCAHITPSGEGLRLVFKVPTGLSLPEAQLWLATRLDTEYDAICKDYARCSYAPQLEDLLYLNDEMFANKVLSQEIPEQEVAVIKALAQQQGGKSKEKAVKAAAEAVVATTAAVEAIAEATAPLRDLTLNGVPYADIIDEWFQLTGGEPVQGCRNARLSQLAYHLRNICDRDQALMLQIMPSFGLPQEEMKALIASACKTTKGGYFMTRDIQKAISLAAAKNGKQVTAGTLAKYEDDAPEMPTVLPPFMKLILSNVPDIYKPAVAMSVFAPLGAHIHGVRLRYIDNKFKEPTFMCCLVAPSGAGKSCVDQPIAHIMADILARDEINRAKDVEIKRENAHLGANTKKKELPAEYRIIQCPLPNITAPRLFEMLDNAQGHFLYTQMDELDGFNKLKDKENYHHYLMRIGYDCAADGQDRVGAQSVNVKCKVRWNWNASTTPGNCLDFFNGQAPTNGTVNRITFCTIPEQDDDAPIPVEGIYTEAFDKALKPYIDNVCKAQNNAKIGSEEYLAIPKANALAKKMDEHCKAINKLSGSKAYKDLFKRACVSAWFRACLLYIIHGKWLKSFDDLIMWTLDNDLHVKMKLFGGIIEAAKAREDKIMHTPKSNTNWLELLPEVFTADDLAKVRAQKNAKSNDTLSQIRNYVRRNTVKRNGDGTFTNLYKLNQIENS